MRIGVLALQGAFREHIAVLERLGVEAVEVRLPEQLDGLDGLIIPGGESTTMMRLMGLYGLDEAIRAFPEPIFGTCAGMIVLDRERLGLIDLTVERNAFGRQVASFEAPIEIDGEDDPVHRRSSSALRGSPRRGRASLFSPRSTGTRCSRARDGFSSRRSIRS